jgi:MarR family transcriptional regulator, organic hydroperoxide resistance regulator
MAKNKSSKTKETTLEKATSKPHPFSFEHPEESTGFLLWQVSMLWQRSVNDVLSEYGLTHAQFVVLAAAGWLTHQQESVTQTDIANHANIDKMMTSTILRGLQQKGLIIRTEHETDMRAKTVLLTNNGQTTLKRALVLVEEIDESLIAPLRQNSAAFAEHLCTIIGAFS